MEISEALDIVVARTGHVRYRDLCDPSHPDYHPGYPALVIAMAEDRPPPAPPPEAPPAVRGLPLAGDVLEAALKRLGAEKLTAWWTARTGQPCACSQRRDAINRADAALRRWIARKAGADPRATEEAAP